MSKRLQVVVDDLDFEQYERSARAHGVSLSEWVRRALKSAKRDESHGDVDTKLAAVRAAARHGYPTADIDTILAQIEQGYGEPATP